MNNPPYPTFLSFLDPLRRILRRLLRCNRIPSKCRSSHGGRASKYTRLHLTSPHRGALHLQDACHTTGGRSSSEGRAAAAERVHTERAKISKPRLREIVRIFSQPLERICTEFHHIRGSIFFSFWRLSASGAAYQNKVANCRLTEVPY